jgi:creatinine amidohydrolase
MSSLEVKQAVKESNGVVVIPVAATEQHGPHLPLDTDTASTVEPVLRAARETRVVVAPTIPWGNSRQNMPFAGTIALKNSTLVELVKDISKSLVYHGFNKIVIVNGHGGNIDPLNQAAEDIKYETGAFTCTVKCWELAQVPAPPGTPEYDGHAGSQETSLMLYLRPEDVDASKYVDSPPKVQLTKYGCVWPPQYGAYDTSPVAIMLDAKECVEYGHFGNPKFASKERGQKVIEGWSKALAEFLKALKDDKIAYMKAK